MFIFSNSAAIISMISFGFAAFIFIKRKKQRLARYLSYILLAASMCLAANSFADFSRSAKLVLFLSGLAIISASFAFSFLFCFIELFIDKDNLTKKKLIIFFLPSFINLILAFTPLYIKNVYFPENAVSQINFGPLIYFLIIFFVVSIFYSIARIKHNYKNFSLIKRNQTKYLISGFTITASGAMLFNIILPLLGEKKYYSLGPQFSVVLMAMAAYAILRHRLFDIRIVIQKTILYALTFGVFLATYLTLIYVFNRFLTLINLASTISSIVSAALIISLYSRFKLYFQKKTDKFFYRYPYDANQVLKEINEKCNSHGGLESFFACFVKIIEEKVKINKILLIILNKNKEPILIKNHNFSRKLVEYLKITKCPEKMYNYFSHNKHASLLKDDYPILKNTILNDQETLKNQDAFEKSGASLILPVYHKDRLIAFFFLGPKLSEEAYYPQDFQLFNALIDSISLTFENIFLYSELKKYSKNLEEKVTKRTRELGELNEKQSRFMADIYHELQTPLAVLKGNLSLMNKKRLDEFETAKSFVRMDRSVDRLSNLIKDLIFLSNADVGKVELKKENINFSELALNMYDDSLILAEDKGVRLRTDIEKNISIKGDREKIKSLLFNLISNALKFTPNGKEIRMRIFKDNNNAYFEIEDQGIGIAEKDLPNLFSRFYRIDHGSGEKGSGLGLAICKWIAEAHGGEIEVKSELGQGSTFKVSLPL
jgi:signal transduction histidine kinase